jgi:carbamoyl-phosphate synthase large subunit
MERIGLKVPESRVVNRVEEALELARQIGFPLIIRPSFTLGGKGGARRTTPKSSARRDRRPRRQPRAQRPRRAERHRWKEFELEVMRDLDDNVVVICSIENLDPMGVHTGDSITVAPAQTLSDRQYQTLRSASLRIIREIGVSTGGSNIQFAVDPAERRFLRDRDEPPGEPVERAREQGDGVSYREDSGQAGGRVLAR